MLFRSRRKFGAEARRADRTCSLAPPAADDIPGAAPVPRLPPSPAVPRGLQLRLLLHLRVRGGEQREQGHRGLQRHGRHGRPLGVPAALLQQRQLPTNQEMNGGTDGEDATSNNSWPVLITTKPLRSMRKLSMMFPIPSDRKTPDQSPSSMLSHLLVSSGFDGSTELCIFRCMQIIPFEL